MTQTAKYVPTYRCRVCGQLTYKRLPAFDEQDQAQNATLSKVIGMNNSDTSGDALLSSRHVPNFLAHPCASPYESIGVADFVGFSRHEFEVDKNA